MLDDLRYAARTLRKNWAFTAAAVATLALGTGGNTAMFTVTSALLLRPLPYREPGRLVLVGVEREQGGNKSDNGFSLGRYELVRDQNRSFAGVAAATGDTADLTGRGEPEQVPIARVSPGFFQTLGLRPQLGRWFTAEEGRPEGAQVVLLSDSLWRSRFGADPAILGQSVNLDGTPQTVVGVLPAGIQFPFLGPAEVWSPRYFELSLLTPQHIRSGVGYLTVIARLRAGASIESAAAEMKVLNKRYSELNPAAPDGGPSVSMVASPLQDATVAGIRTELLLLSGSFALILLIACSNVAGLLLARALGRRKEMAVRVALGAGRGALVAQLLLESVLLALAGGALGLFLGWVAARALAAFGGDLVPYGVPIGLDWRVLSFALAIALAAGFAFGIFPALHLSRTGVDPILRGAGRGVAGGRGRVKSALLIAQMALSMVLLIGAGLLVRSFANLLRVDPGFGAGNVLTMNISLPTATYHDPERQVSFFDELLRRVSALPGVRAAAVSAALPLTQVRISPILPEGQPEVPLAQRPFVDIEAISPAFFGTMHIPLRAGRPFTDADTARAPKVVIVNEALARRFWPDRSPVGRHLAVGRRSMAEIVGVAGNSRNNGLALDPSPQVYLPFAQLPWGNMNLLVRCALEPHALISAARAQVLALDPNQPVTNVRTVSELMDRSRAQPRFTMLLLGTFAALSVFLAAVGIYGVLSQAVGERRQELGIRMALGADGAALLRMVVGRGLALTGGGIGLGLIASLAATRAMRSVLFQVGVYDLTAFALASIVFAIVGLAASYLPARRATRVDPAEVLRDA